MLTFVNKDFEMKEKFTQADEEKKTYKVPDELLDSNFPYRMAQYLTSFLYQNKDNGWFHLHENLMTVSTELCTTYVYDMKSEVTIFARKPLTIWTGLRNLKGKCQGFGTAYLANGMVFVGTMDNGKKNGHGFNKWVDGQMYHGEHKDGKVEGLGYEVYINGETYSGEFKDGKYNGLGRYTWPSG